jgi:AcrR family transcriptional regulator
VLSNVCNNLVMRAASVRARVRAQMIDEIKATARRHLATDGANLSLRAVARDMGMVSSALYRYFASRDDLLTALIIDAYNALGDLVEAGDAAVTDRGDLRGRWLACCHAVRRWALTNSAQYALIFGSPVPGYAAPQDTTVAAQRTPAVLIGILSDGVTSGTLAAPDPAELPAPVRADLVATRDEVFPGLPEAVLARGSIGWIHLFGAVSFELFGQLNNVIEAREEYFDYQMRQLGQLIGL